MRKVSAIVPYGTRKYNAGRIADSLSKIFQEIIFIDDAYLVYSRFIAIQRAAFDTIYTQDDDVINHDLEKLFNSFSRKPDKIHYAVPEDYLEKIPSKTYKESQLALIGWGSMFMRDKTKVLDIYSNRYGVDGLLMREADRAFTLLQCEHHIPVVSKLEFIPDPVPSPALSAEPEHIEKTNKMIERCLDL